MCTCSSRGCASGEPFWWMCASHLLCFLAMLETPFLVAAAAVSQVLITLELWCMLAGSSWQIGLPAVVEHAA